MNHESIGLFKQTLQGVLLVLLSILINWLAQANEIFIEGNPLFGLFSFVPLLLFFYNCCATSKVATRIGALYGLITTLSSYFWLANFGEFSLWTIGAVSLGYMGYYSAFFRVLYHVLSPQRSVPVLANRSMLESEKSIAVFLPKDSANWRSPFANNRPLVFAVAWTCFEYLKSRGYLAFPWNLAAFPFHSFVELSQIAEIAGVWILSFFVLLFQASLGEVLLKIQRGLRYVAASVLVFALFLVYGFIRISDFEAADVGNGGGGGASGGNGEVESRSAEDSLLVLLVQQNADSWQSDYLSPLETVIDLSRSGLSEAQELYGRRPDIVSWSETSLRFPYEQNRAFYEEAPSPVSFNGYLRESGSDLLSGVPLVRSDSRFMNGVIHLNAQGDILGDYGKIHLIPFAEHVPLSDLSYMKNFMENVVGLPGSGWTAGSEIRTMYLEEKRIRIGTPVCFEDSFGNNTRAFVRSGADILINLTNNAWSRTESAQMQHFIAARYRAIENRRSLLRSTNAGLSSIVLPSGRIQNSIPMFEEGYLLDEVKIERNGAMTLYTLLGDWFAQGLLFVMIAILVLRFRQRPS